MFFLATDGRAYIQDLDSRFLDSLLWESFPMSHAAGRNMIKLWGLTQKAQAPPRTLSPAIVYHSFRNIVQQHGFRHGNLHNFFTLVSAVPKVPPCRPCWLSSGSFFTLPVLPSMARQAHCIYLSSQPEDPTFSSQCGFLAFNSFAQCCSSVEPWRIRRTDNGWNHESTCRMQDSAHKKSWVKGWRQLNSSHTQNQEPRWGQLELQSYLHAFAMAILCNVWQQHCSWWQMAKKVKDCEKSVFSRVSINWSFIDFSGWNSHYHFKNI